jgi:hypothetical protein
MHGKKRNSESSRKNNFFTSEQDFFLSMRLFPSRQQYGICILLFRRNEIKQGLLAFYYILKVSARRWH